MRARREGAPSTPADGARAPRTPYRPDGRSESARLQRSRVGLRAHSAHSVSGPGTRDGKASRRPRRPLPSRRRSPCPPAPPPRPLPAAHSRRAGPRLQDAMLAAQALPEPTQRPRQKRAPAAAACAPGTGSRPAAPRKGSAGLRRRAGGAGLRHPPRPRRPPPLSMRGAAGPERGRHACAGLARMRDRGPEAPAPGTASGSVGT